MAKRREVILGLPALGIAALAGSPGRSYSRLPQKVVTTELILTETALALGLTPLASGNLPLYRRLVGTPALPPTTSDLGPLNEPNMELLVHLAPDLILAADWQRGPLAALERIAPVLWLETLPFTRPPLEIATALAQDIAAATQEEASTAVAALTRSLDAGISTLREALRAAPPPLLIARFLEDGRHALVFTEGSMPGDVLAQSGGRNARPGSAPGAVTMGTGDLIALGAPVLSLGPLPESALFRRLSAASGFRALPLPPLFPAGGLVSARRFAEAAARALRQA